MNSVSSKTRLIFYGTPEFSAICLQTFLKQIDFEVLAVITKPDKEAGRGQDLQSSPVKSLALASKIPVLQPQSIKKQVTEFSEQLKGLGRIDVGIVIAFGQILPLEVLKIPAAGSVNVHASLLPRWRGAAPIQRAIEAGDKETGICLMDMEAGLDTGGVYVASKLPILPVDTFESLHDKLAVLSCKLLNENLRKIVAGTLIAIPQASEGVTYANRIEKKEALIDWHKPATELRSKIHAFSPFPGAYSILKNKRIKFLRVAEKSGSGTSPPGTITLVDKDRLEVQCLESTLSVVELQAEGKKALPIKEFLAGNALNSGLSFGK